MALSNTGGFNIKSGVSIKTGTSFSLARTAQLTLLSVAWFVGLNSLLMGIVLSYYPALTTVNQGGAVSIASHLTGLETTPPVVSIIYPASGSTATSTTVTFHVTASDVSGI